MFKSIYNTFFNLFALAEIVTSTTTAAVAAADVAIREEAELPKPPRSYEDIMASIRR